MRMRRLIAAVLAVLVAFPLVGDAQRRGRLRIGRAAQNVVSDGSLVATHPRVLVNTAELTALNTKVHDSYFSEFQLFVTEEATRLTSPLPLYGTDWRNDLTNDAIATSFICAIGSVTSIDYGGSGANTVTTYCNRAVAIAEAYRTRILSIATYNLYETAVPGYFEDATSLGALGTYGQVRTRSLAGAFFWPTYPVPALVYDWNYNILNSTQRAGLVNDDYNSSGASGDYLVTAGAKGSSIGWRYGIKQGPSFAAYESNGNTWGTGQQCTNDGTAWNYYDSLYKSLCIVSGLSFAGDGVNDTRAAEMYGLYSTYGQNATRGTLDAYSFFSGADGGFKNLNTYSTVEGSGILPLFLMLESWRTTHALTRAETWGASYANVLRTYPQWQAYRIRPWAVADPGTTYSTAASGHLEYFLYSDSVNQESPTSVYHAYGGASGLMEIMKAMTGYAGVDNNMAGLARYLLNQYIGDYANAGYALGEGSQVFADFILGSKAAGAKSPTDLNLPLTKLFGDPTSGAGMGQMVMRTGWTNVNDTYVTDNGMRWHGGGSGTTEHTNGSITIDRQGPLIIHAGSGGHGFFSNQAYSENIPLFLDPTETPKGGNTGDPVTAYNAAGGDIGAVEWDMGAQRSTGAITLANCGLECLVAGSKADFGGITRSRTADTDASGFTVGGRKVDYAFHLMTPAYNSNDASYYHDTLNTQKVHSATRQFMYFRRTDSSHNDVVLEFDRLESTGTQFLKREYWHLSADPTITNSGATTAVRTGLTTYGVASLAVVANTSYGSDGKLWLTPLLPTSVTMRKVGGPNGSGQWTDIAGIAVKDAHEFESPLGDQLWNQFSSQASSLSLTNARQYYGPYRIEIEPTTPALYDNFLTVFDIGTSATSRQTTELWTGTNYKAARVGPYVGAFADTETTPANGSIRMQTLGDYTVKIADLPGSSRTVMCGGNITSVTSYDGTGACNGAFAVDSQSKTIELLVHVNASANTSANDLSW